jgi:hypothetical protein
MPIEMRLEEAPKREDIMSNVVIGTALAAAVLAMSSIAAVSAPMNGSLVCKAASSLNPLTPARCICSRRGFHGRCYAWSCR